MFDCVSLEILFKHLNRIKFPHQINRFIRNLNENLDVRLLRILGQLEKQIIEMMYFKEVLMDHYNHYFLLNCFRHNQRVWNWRN